MCQMRLISNSESSTSRHCNIESGGRKRLFVELSNNAGYDTDISNWILASDNKSFTIPRNRLLLQKKITLSPKITGFSILDKNTLKLMTMQGVLVLIMGLV